MPATSAPPGPPRPGPARPSAWPWPATPRPRKETLLRLEPRATPSPRALLLAPLATTWGLLLDGGFGSVFAWSETRTRAVPLMLTGLAAAVAFQARLVNIG